MQTIDKTKICSKCKQEKSYTAFWKDKSLLDGHTSHCKECGKRYNQNRYQKDPKKSHQKSAEYKKKYPRKALDYRLKNSYNITIEQYDQMFEGQKGVCAICGKREASKNQYGIQRLGVDHNHITEQVRGLLCVSCNTAIGSLKVDEKGVELLLKAIEYIRNS